MCDFKLRQWRKRAHRRLRLRQREVIPARDNFAPPLEDGVEQTQQPERFS